jgi:hypothetical protein
MSAILETLSMRVGIDTRFLPQSQSNLFGFPLVTQRAGA